MNAPPVSKHKKTLLAPYLDRWGGVLDDIFLMMVTIIMRIIKDGDDDDGGGGGDGMIWWFDMERYRYLGN